MRNTSWIAATLKSGVAFTALLSSSAIGLAAETELDDIIVIANRTETEASKVGSTTHVVTEDDLKQDGSTFVSEYLTKLPGISFGQDGGAGKASSLRMRGLSGRYIKVLLDGIDISDPSGTQIEARLEHVLLNDVERIEILKGSHSALYGGQAVGGVINIITKRAEAGTVRHNATIEGGSYGTVNASYGFQAASDRADIALNIQRFHTDGFSAITPTASTDDEDGYENTSFSANGSVDVTEDLNLYFVARSTAGRSEYDGNTANSRNKSKSDLHFGKVGANLGWFDDQMTTDFSFQITDITREYFGERPSLGEGRRYKGELLNTFDANEYLTLNFGADWMHEDYVNYGSSRILGGYVEAIVDPTDELSFSASSRLDHHSRFGPFWSGRVTTSYQVLEGTRLRSSVGNGFRAPALNELFGQWGPNPDLKPETSLSFDAGIDQDFLNDKLRFSAAYFHILTDDLIDWVRTSLVTFDGEYRQISGLSRSQGAEFSANWDLLENLSLHGAYTYTWAIGSDKKRLRRVPLHDVTAGVTYKPMDELSLNLNANYVSGIEDKGALDDFLLVNAKASYDVNDNLRVHVRGENLLDQDYERINGYQTPGLSVYAGLSASF